MGGERVQGNFPSLKAANRKNGLGRKKLSFGLWWGQIREQIRQAKGPARGIERGLLGGLRSDEIGGCRCEVGTDQGILLRAKIDFVLIEKVLAGRDLVEGVAVENALRANGGERALDFGDSAADIGVGLQGRIQILDGGENIARSVLEQLAAGKIGLYGIAVGDPSRGDTCVPVVGDRAGAGIESKGLGTDGSAAEKIGALIACIGETDELRLNSLHFDGDGLAIAAIQSAVGAFGAEREGASERGDDVTEGRIGNLETRL